MPVFDFRALEQVNERIVVKRHQHGGSHYDKANSSLRSLRLEHAGVIVIRLRCPGRRRRTDNNIYAAVSVVDRYDGENGETNSKSGRGINQTLDFPDAASSIKEFCDNNH